MDSDLKRNLKLTISRNKINLNSAENSAWQSSTSIIAKQGAILSILILVLAAVEWHFKTKLNHICGSMCGENDKIFRWNANAYLLPAQRLYWRKNYKLDIQQWRDTKLESCTFVIAWDYLGNCTMGRSLFFFLFLWYSRNFYFSSSNYSVIKCKRWHPVTIGTNYWVNKLRHG